MRCESLAYLFAVCCFSKVLADDEVHVFTNPGYPKPYKGTIPKYRYVHSVEQGRGVALLFHQFLANTGDCVTACDADSVCQSLCGDVMDHPKTKKILVTNSSATITMQSISAADGSFHSGIYAKSMSFDLTERSYFKCNSTVELEDGEPFFLVSQNYPNTPFDYAPCEVSFTAKDMIRAAVYDLVTLNSVLFEGTDDSGSPMRTELSGRHVTDDEPVALYSSKSLRVSFTFSNHSTFYTRGFYILVDSFARGSVSSHACVNGGASALKSGESMRFGTANFGSIIYEANMDCSYTFSNHLEDHQLAISMDFETEKCCDIMYIIGIAPPPYNLYNYQGYMQNTFQFASENVISMNFTSDGVVQGAGFNGSVYSIDCACHDGVLQMNQDVTVLKVASPGFLSGAPTYCPNLTCSWIVQFITNYEVILNATVTNLRTATQMDQLNIDDNFGRTLLTTNSTIYYGPTELILTSGEFLITFTSSPVTFFSPPATQSGFLLDLLLVKRSFQRTTIDFTDDNFMADISTRLFSAGLNTTYEYAITARPGRQVTVYFFTTVNSIANLEIYDGADIDAKMINSSSLYGEFVQDGTPLWVRSTGEKLLVQVRPNIYSSMGKLDFQAMATDYYQEDGCPPMVWTAATPSKQTTIELTGSSCLSIFHATNNYSTSAGVVAQLKNSSQVALYKGLTTNATHLVNSASTSDYPAFIYGAYVVVSYKLPQENSVTYSWNTRGFVTTLTMESNQSGIIMSEDYLPQFPMQAVEQQFSIELLSDSGHMTGIRIEFLRPTGQGHGILQMQQYNELLDEIPYPASDGKTVFEECGTKMIISYQSPGGTSNGLYARYSRGSRRCNSAGLVNYSLVHVILLLLALIRRRLW